MSNEAFEKWWKNNINVTEIPLFKNQYPDGTWSYTDHKTDLSWITWQAGKADSEREIAELKALSKTPAQSLQEHDNEVIEKCAIVCENSDRHRGEYFATKIRALKVK